MKILKKIIVFHILYIVTVYFAIPPAIVNAVEPKTPEIVAPSALIMDASTGIVIYDKNMHEKKYPASITKIMTALLTLEHTENLSERITFSHNAVFSLPYGSSHIAMDEDETLSIEEALYALMLASANEVANALAEHIAGSTEAFAVKMTEKAKSLGALNTNFSNPHGLHGEDHYTTAYDMALIMRAAVQEPQFVKLISTSFYEIPYTEKNPEPKSMHNTNRLIQTSSEYFHEDVVGSKTGFTNEAGQTLVTYGKRGELELITVVMQDDKPGLYTDTHALLDYGFERFKKVDFFDSYSTYLPVTQISRNVPAASSKKQGFLWWGGNASPEEETETEEEITLGLVPVKSEKSLSALLPDVVTKENVEQRVELPDKLAAPVKEGDTVGKISLLYQDILLGETDILAQETIAMQEDDEPVKEESGSGLTKLLLNIGKIAITLAAILVFGFVLLVIIVRSVYKLKRRRRKILRKRRNDDAVMKIYRYRNH